MKKQKVMSQMKGWDKTPEGQLNEEKVGNVPKKKELRIMIVKIQDLRKKFGDNFEKIQEMFTKDLEELKNKQTKTNNTLEIISSRITEAEEWTSDLEDRMVEITAQDKI